MGYFETYDAINTILGARGMAKMAVRAASEPRDLPSLAIGWSMLSTDAVLDHMNEVKAQIDDLHGAIVANGERIPKDFAESWFRFGERWRAWYDTNREWSARLTGAGEIDAQTTLFQRDVRQYWEQFKKITGVEPTGPAPIVHAATELDTKKPLDFGPMGWAVVGVLGIAAAAFLVRAVKS